MRKPLVIFGSGDIAQLAHYYFNTDSNYEVVAFTVDANYIKESEFCGLPVVVFEDVAKTDWVTHLPKMYAFWETVIFGTGGFSGNPLAAHARLTPMTTMGREQFERWLLLFHGTVDDLFSGEKAEHIKRAAGDMANVIYSRINHVPDARFDPANLTAEQRERYQNYKKD